jgi:hypothetical protein
MLALVLALVVSEALGMVYALKAAIFQGGPRACSVRHRTEGDPLGRGACHARQRCAEAMARAYGVA